MFKKFPPRILQVLVVMLCPLLYAKQDDNKIPIFSDDFTGTSSDGDSFGKVDAANWVVGGRAEGASVSNDAMQLKTPGEEGTDIRVTSKDTYLYATVEMRIRFSKLGEKTYYYLGFMSREPWAENAACVMNTNSMTLSLSSSKNGAVEISDSEPIDPEKWYTLKIQWTARGVELAIDGNPSVKLLKSDSIPDLSLPLIFDVVSQMGEAAIDVDWVKVYESAE